MTTARAVLKPRKARPFFGRHPWVLDSAIERVEGTVQDGDVVTLVTDQGQEIARGFWNSQSRLRVRLYSWLPGEMLDDAFWRRRIDAALSLRSRWRAPQSDGAVRLINSEADGLSGLVVDRFADFLVLQVSSLGISQRLESILEILAEHVRPRGMVLRSDRAVAQLEGLNVVDGPCWGEVPEGPIFITEHGLRYGIDVRGGQKTGFFLDQSENRRVAAGYFAGRHVLDVCCYTGAFGLCAVVLGGAREVLGVDSSSKAITLARANAELNGVPRIRFDVGDCFETMTRLIASGQRFGGVILDPPKFARQRSATQEALRAYYQLNRLAVDLLQPDGILVTCSCSGYVSREDFLHVLAQVAQQTHREIQVLESRGAANDHPVTVTCLESEYLKCCICRVV